MEKTHLKMTVNGKEVELLTEPRQLLDPCVARGTQPDRRTYWL
jgi:hypothetical protein